MGEARLGVVSEDLSRSGEIRRGVHVEEHGFGVTERAYTLERDHMNPNVLVETDHAIVPPIQRSNDGREATRSVDGTERLQSQRAIAPRDHGIKLGESVAEGRNEACGQKRHVPGRDQRCVCGVLERREQAPETSGAWARIGNDRTVICHSAGDGVADDERGCRVPRAHDA
jgi:hypothetical protein